MTEQDSEALRGWISLQNPGALLADGFEDAIIGLGERCGQPSLVVYDAEKCIAILMQRDGMERDEAEEFFSFNTLGAWAGENTPLFVWRPHLKQDRIIVETVIRAGEWYLCALLQAVTKVGMPTPALDKARTELLDAVEKLAQATERR